MDVSESEIDDLQAEQITPVGNLWEASRVTKTTICMPLRLRGGSMRIGPDNLVKNETRKWIDCESTAGFSWEFYFSTSIIVSGIGTLCTGDRLVTQRDQMPKFWKELVYDKRFAHQFDIDREKTLPVGVVDEPCLSFSTWGFDNYGHVILDQLPRLCAAQQLIGPSLKILLRSDTPDWSLTMLRHFGVSDRQIIKFDHRVERVQLTRGVFPAYGRQDGMIHPIVALMFDRVCDKWPRERDRGTRVFLSRSGLSDERKRARNCLNERELGEIARDFGCSIVSPEQMTFYEQVSLFRSAELIVGLVGSALHTSIFSDDRPIVGFVGFNAMAQPQISRLRGQKFATLDAGVDLSQSYEVSASNFRQVMQSLAEVL